MRVSSQTASSASSTLIGADASNAVERDCADGDPGDACDVAAPGIRSGASVEPNDQRDRNVVDVRHRDDAEPRTSIWPAIVAGGAASSAPSDAAQQRYNRR